MLDLYNADCLVQLAQVESNSIDGIVTDPPYFIGVLEHDWDEADEADPKAFQDSYASWAKEAYRVLKPGASMAAFGYPTTAHRMTCAFEDVGFEIRDTLVWIHAGQPHGQNVAKALDKKYFRQWLKSVGYDATPKEMNALSSDYSQGRTSTEAFARFVEQVGKIPPWGVPVLLPTGEVEPAHPDAKRASGMRTTLKPCWEPIVIARKPPEGSVGDNFVRYGVGGFNVGDCSIPVVGGDVERYPSNVLVDPGGSLDEETVVVVGSSTLARPDNRATSGMDTRSMGWRFKRAKSHLAETDIGDGLLGPATRIYVIPKASTSEKDEGLPEGVKNDHPTVKPVLVMAHLVKMIVPREGICLDPFMGSGTTGVACVDTGRNFIGIDKTSEYVDLARHRIMARAQRTSLEDLISQLPE